MARFFDSVLAGATVAPSGAFLVVSAALVAGAAGAVAGDVVSAASTGAASRPTASRDAAIRFIVREPPGPLLHGTGPRGYGGASLRARVSTPVDVLEHGGRRFLVAGRGETQWVRNARASGQVTLRKGMRGEACRLRALSDAEKPEVLKAYLDRFKMTVQRYFPIPAGSPVERFAPVAAGYPVFELKAGAREGGLTSGE